MTAFKAFSTAYRQREFANFKIELNEFEIVPEIQQQSVDNSKTIAAFHQ